MNAAAQSLPSLALLSYHSVAAVDFFLDQPLLLGQANRWLTRKVLIAINTFVQRLVIRAA
jgi:hypothetical protein